MQEYLYKIYEWYTLQKNEKERRLFTLWGGDVYVLGRFK